MQAQIKLTSEAHHLVEMKRRAGVRTRRMFVLSGCMQSQV